MTRTRASSSACGARMATSRWIWTRVRHAPSSTDEPLGWRVSEVLQQFGSPVHDVDISNDGLVYVSDRGNKRVQVFTPEGKFVAEQFVGLDSKDILQARSTAFSPDQRFLYVGGTPVIYILNRKTLEVLGSFVTGSAQEHPPGPPDRGRSQRQRLRGSGRADRSRRKERGHGRL